MSRADAGARRRLLIPAGRSLRAGERPPFYAARLADDRWVLLDVLLGEYLTVGPAQVGAERPPDLRAVDAGAALREALACAGLDGRRVEMAAPPVPASAEAQAPAPDPVLTTSTARDVVLFVLALAVTARELRRSFPELIRPRRLRGPLRGVDETVRQARVFAQLLVWSPWQGECLFRSCWLVRYLQLQGCAAEWVFGVRGWPLQAHCWVRRQGILLNETPDAVLAYRELAVF